MVSEAEYETFISELANAVKSIDMKVNFLGQQISEVKAEKSQFPKYFAADSDQMENELRSRGLLTKPEEGLQDDIRYSFSMFTNINEQGGLVPGLVGAHGPASLMELYQTMDLRGITFNYGWGWLSALKGGYNSKIADSKQSAAQIIKNIKEEAKKEHREDLEIRKTYQDLDRGQLQNELLLHELMPKEHNFSIYQTFKNGEWKDMYRILSSPTSDTYPDDWPSHLGRGESMSSFTNIPAHPMDIGKITVTRETKTERENYFPRRRGENNYNHSVTIS